MSNRKTDYFVYAICVFFVSLPLGAMNLMGAGSALKFIGLLPLIVFLFHRIPATKLDRITLIQLALTLWISATLLWSVDYESSAESIKTQWLFFGLILPIGAYTFSEGHIRKFRTSLRWASRITAAITLGLGVSVDGRLWLRGRITEDPNYLCAYFLFGIAGSFIGLLEDNKKAIKALSAIELLLYFYIVLLTGSRGGTLSVVSVLIVLFLFYNANRNDRRTFGKKIAIVAVILIGGAIILPSIPQNLLERFTIESAIESRGTHRLDIWERALRIFADAPFERMLVGFGYNASRTLLGLHGYPRQVLHNVFLEYLVGTGFLGFVIYCKSVYMFCKFAVKEADLFSVSIVVGMVILSLSTSIISFKPYWDILIYILCACAHKEKQLT